MGGKTVEVNLPANACLQDVLDVLLARFPGLHRELYDANGNLAAAVHIFVNGRDAHWLPQFLETRINPDDVIDIFPPVGGG